MARTLSLVVALTLLASCYVEVRAVPVTPEPSGSNMAAGAPVPAHTPSSCPLVQANGHDIAGTFVVLGEAHCAGIVLLRIYDGSGKEIGIAYGSTLTSRTGMEGTAAFSILYPNPPATVGSFHVEVQPAAAAPSPSAASCELTAPPVKQNRGDLLELSGSIRCSGPSEATFVKVAAAFYDASGLVIGVGADYFMQGHVAPGATAPFSVRFGGPTIPPASVASYRIFIDWR